MEIKRLVTQFVYRIEAKPGGGFIARNSDPATPPIEAPTREELVQKVQAKMAAALTAEFPALRLPLDGEGISFRLGKFLSGQLTPSSAGIQLRTVKTDGGGAGSFAEKILAGAGSEAAGTASAIQAPPAIFASSGDLISNRPIVPEAGNGWKVIRFLLALLVVAGIAYFFLYRG